MYKSLVSVWGTLGPHVTCCYVGPTLNVEIFACFHHHFVLVVNVKLLTLLKYSGEIFKLMKCKRGIRGVKFKIFIEKKYELM